MWHGFLGGESIAEQMAGCNQNPRSKHTTLRRTSGQATALRHGANQSQKAALTNGPLYNISPRSFLHNHIDLAVERISPRIVGFSFDAIEEQVTIFAQDATRIGDAHTILPSGVAFFGARIHGCDELPASGSRVGLVP